MNRAKHIYIAVVLTVSGALFGAAITFHWLSEQISDAVTLGGVA